MLNRLHIAGIFILAAALPVVLFADVAPQTGSSDYLIHTWRTDDGLPQNWVSSIVQTPDGYLWIGTRYGGLARFDGVRFVAFNQQNTPALKDVQVEHLSLDQAGRLWIIMGNESITALQNGRFHLFRWPRSEPRLRAANVLSLQSNEVLFAGEFPYLARLNLASDTNGWTLLDPQPNTVPRSETFAMDKDGVVWFVTQAHHLGKFQDNRFERRDRFPGQPGVVVADVALDARCNLWMATREHLASWNGKLFEDRTPTNGPPPTRICSMAFCGDGGLWVLEDDRLRKWKDGQWVAEARPWNLELNFPLDPQQMQLYGDAQGNAWLISYGHGLWHIAADGTAHHLTEQDGLPSSFITCWFQDQEGDVWIGTAGGGIARIRKSIFHVFREAQGLPGKVVRSICVDTDDRVWAGTLAGGLACLQDGRFVKMPMPTTDASPVESITVAPNLDGGLWIGSLNHGLAQLKEKEISPVDTTGSSLGNSIRVLYTDRKNQLWIGGLVDLYKRANGQIQQYGSSEGFVDGHAIGALAEDDAGALWIGTGPGQVWKYYQDRFTRFNPPAKWPSVRFSALLPDTNGTVWVGTLGGGLLRLRDGKFSRCTTENGLPDNNVSQLLDSQDGHIWAGTYAGIFRASKADLNAVADGTASRVPCRVYGRFEGLPALECSSGFQPSCWHAKDGRLWFTTANGVVSINPSEVSPNQVPPIVSIEELLVDGEPVKLTPENLGSPATNAHPSKLRIRPGRHYLQFRFTGLNFAAPDGVRFRVKLEGADAQWRDIGGQRLVGYGPLPPGDYRLDVLACNNEGVWNNKGDSLPFVVLPYFWETWWFKAALAIGAFMVLGIIVALAQRRRYRARLERVERQREMERERTRIARDLHDDLGTSLTQISMLSALANRKQTPPAEARTIVEQVRGCARDMVTALDEIVWAVNPKNDSLIELVNYLGHFAEQFFRLTDIRCRLEIPSQLPSWQLPADVRHHLFLAFKEALNNAARHSGATQVLVRVEIHAREAIICVKDNGHGFDSHAAPALRKGNGLTNMERRIEDVGGRIKVQSAPGQGTTVIFCLPLKHG